MVQPTPYININIFMLKINSFENASAVNVGQNLLAEWQNSDKKIKATDRILEMRADLWAREAMWMTETKLILRPLLKVKRLTPQSKGSDEMFFSPSVVNVGGFKINTMDRGSSLTLGPYQQVDYFLSAKINQGFGEENGDFTPLVVPISNVLDADLVDSNSAKNSVV